MQKTVAILGASGSVGMQAIDVARARGYKPDFLTARRDVETLEALAREFSPRAVAMSDERCADELRIKLSDTEVRVLSGADGIREGIMLSQADTVVNSILGEAGLMPTLTVIESGKRLALANKESLVIAGDIVMSRARERGVEILPVDSEHSAIFQSLHAGRKNEIKKLILTASGGPFYSKSRAELSRVTLEDALAHPTWRMGKKITVDSATLMNKGFEVIEAAHLFGVDPSKIEVVIHRESILHSAVEYIDNTVIGEMSVPDMRSCVQYAVDYPDRCEATVRELDFFKIGSLTFARPDTESFPLLALAKRAIADGGAMPAVLNAADEIAVDAFLRERVGFTDIFDIVGEAYEKMADAKSASTIEAIIECDRRARSIANSLI